MEVDLTLQNIDIYDRFNKDNNTRPIIVHFETITLKSKYAVDVGGKLMGKSRQGGMV